MTTPLRWLFAALLTLSFDAARAADCPPTAVEPAPDAIAALAATASDHGVLWRLRRDGHDSYLYGTLHVGRLAWALPGPQMRQAWQKTGVLAVELDITDPATLQALGHTPPLPKPLSADVQARLDAQVRAACLPEGLVTTLHPVMLLSTLTVLAGRWDDLDIGYAQEQVLLGMAHAGARKIVPLESAEEQLAAIIPKDPKDLQRSIDDGLSQLEHNEVRAPMLKLAQAWASGDIATLQSYDNWCDCIHDDADRRLMHALLDERNPHLAQRIADLHASGQRVFAAVGALHMTGPGGLPALLAKMGFEVQRLVPAE